MNTLPEIHFRKYFSGFPVFSHRLRALIFLTVLLLPVFSLSADPVRGEFWVRDDRMELLPPEENRRNPNGFSGKDEEVLNEVLEDARWVFSGMIYGFSVSWTPSSRSRDVEEELQIVPLALIPRGDPRMRAVSITRENGFDYILFEYNPDPGQEKRLEGWRSEALPAAAGAGTVPMISGSRRDALKAAIRESIRAYLRVRDFNRPREIKGRVAFTEFPFTSLESGSIRASVQLRLDLEPVRPYAVD